jgi:carbon storage regulator
MLVLSRKVGEEIVIGTNIQITVVAIKGEKVRIGITAPKEVVVDRQEIHEIRKGGGAEADLYWPHWRGHLGSLANDGPL